MANAVLALEHASFYFDSNADDDNSQQINTHPNGSWNSRLYLQTHECENSRHFDGQWMELYAHYAPEGDWLSWHLTFGGDDFPIKYCPFCGFDLDAMIVRAD